LRFTIKDIIDSFLFRVSKLVGDFSVCLDLC